MYLTQSIRRAAQQAPDKPATIFGERTRTWGEFVDRVARLAGGLAGLGVKPGDRVAILSLNSDWYLEYYFGCFWLGAVVVPMNLRWSARENAYSLNDSGAETLFVDDAFIGAAPEILKEAKGVRNLVHMGEGEPHEGWIGYNDLIARSAPIADGGFGGEDLAGLFYTGGTTGFPKGVMLPHRGLWSSAMATAFATKVPEDAVYLHSAPMFHLADGAMGMAVTIVGATHTFIPAFDAKQAIAVIEKTGVTDGLLVPTMVKMILNDPDLAKADISTLKRVCYGGSPMPEGVIRAALDEMPGVGWYQLYGQTELSPVATCNPAENHALEGERAKWLKSAGRAALCNEIIIVDEHDEEVPRGTVGEIVARGPNALLGYWNLPEQTAETLRNGWVHTGDMGYMDEDGYVFIADRLKDMIITGGENVYSVEVENAISTHPEVDQVAVVGIPSEKWGEAVHAVVVLRPGSEVREEDIVTHCRELIAHYKCPQSVEIRSDAMPLSGAGKILKRDLRAPFWEGHDRQVG